MFCQKRAEFDGWAALEAFLAEPIDQARFVITFGPLFVSVVRSVAVETWVQFCLEEAGPIGERVSHVHAVLVICDTNATINLVLVNIVAPERHHAEGFRWRGGNTSTEEKHLVGSLGAVLPKTDIHISSSSNID